jgi:hypothetical protein
MNLHEVFDQLSYGELSQLYIGGLEGSTGIRNVDRVQVTNHIQLGLTAIYKRFRLLEGILTLNLQTDVTDYVITKDFIASNTYSIEAVKYLTDDPVFPYENNLLKIEEVKDDLGTHQDINNKDNIYSLMTRSPTHLHVPSGIVTLTYRDPVITTLTLVYRANHPLIDIELAQLSPDEVVLRLPDAYLQALLYYVASRAHNPAGMSNEFHAGNSWYAKYESECLKLEAQNYQADNTNLSTQFERRGFI